MERLKKLKCINSFDLKLLAMVFMLCDHLWATVIPGSQWLTNIGRMAFPIFAFQIAEGFANTGSFKNYLKRMIIFALISEMPFDLVYSQSIFYPFHQNVLFTFVIALLLLYLIKRSEEKGRIIHIITCISAVILGFIPGFLFMTDYYGFGVVTVLVFYIFRKMPLGWFFQLIALYIINADMMGGLVINLNLGFASFEIQQQALALLAFIPIFMYNGEKGRQSKKVRTALYWFYPVHLLVLWALWTLITL